MSLITNRRALRTEIPPAEMAHRDGQMDHLRSILEPIQDGRRVDGALIYGPPGGGKTHAARLLSSRLAQAAGQVSNTHIDCWRYTTDTAIVTQLLEAIGPVATPGNAATYDLLETLRDGLDGPCVVILDEADQIEDDRVLYELHELPQVTLLLIANDYGEFFAGVDMRVESRLTGYPPVEFPKYSHEQLAAILSRRLERGVRPGVVTADVVDTIVDIAENDARKAIDTLRGALDRAAARGRERVTVPIVREVAPETERELARKTVSKLTRTQRVLYEILVEDGGEMPIGDIYGAFRERYEPGGRGVPSQKTAKRHLKKMAHYDLVGFGGANSGRRYWAATDALYPAE